MRQRVALLWTTRCCPTTTCREKLDPMKIGGTTTFSYPRFQARTRTTATTRAVQLAGHTPTSPPLTSKTVPWLPSWCPARRATKESWRWKRVAVAVGATRTCCILSWARRKTQRCSWRQIGVEAFHERKTEARHANSCSTTTRLQHNNRGNTPRWWRSNWSTTQPTKPICLTWLGRTCRSSTASRVPTWPTQAAWRNCSEWVSAKCEQGNPYWKLGLRTSTRESQV